MCTYDLILRGGRVIDPRQRLDRVADVGLKDDHIAEISEHLPVGVSSTEIDVSGKLVMPGLIDIHCHVFPGVTPGLSVEAYENHLQQGTTTIVDAGSAGAYTIAGFRRYVVEPAQARILALLNISAVGMLCANRQVTELGWLPLVDLPSAERAIEAHRDIIVGLKVRLSEYIVQKNGITPLRLALPLAEKTGLPVMVHIGGTPVPLGEILNLLRAGDVLTHTYTAFAGFETADDGKSVTPRFQTMGDASTILDAEGNVIPEAWAARERGVLFDVGHGGGSFSFDVFQAATVHGFWPDTIGTDLNESSVHGPVYSLPSLMSRFLSLGLSLSQVIEACTYRPARWLGLSDQIGSLMPGAAADIAVLDLHEGAYQYRDSVGQSMRGGFQLIPYLTICGGQLIWPAAGHGA